jgi:hypothetical protein
MRGDGAVRARRRPGEEEGQEEKSGHRLYRGRDDRVGRGGRKRKGKGGLAHFRVSVVVGLWPEVGDGLSVRAGLLERLHRTAGVIL